MQNEPSASRPGSSIWDPLALEGAQASLGRVAEEILSIWESRVRAEVKSSTVLLRPALRNALPKFLIMLGQALSERSSRGLLKEGTQLVQSHADVRARNSEYSAPELVQELQLLREIVTSHLEKELNLSDAEYETIQKTFDQTIQETLLEFFLVHAELREQFTAALGHDLRNPLSAALMNAQLILRMSADATQPDPAQDIVRLAKKIVGSLERADRMIQDLLDESLLRIGKKPEIHLLQIDLLALTREVVAELKKKERSRIQISGTRLLGYWDGEGLRRALENLLKNAMKYGAADTLIQIKFSTSRGRVKLSVHNQGEPISENEKKLIFRSFERSRTARTSGRQGWGLGLALVRAVAESMGGTVTVQSDRGRGTIFTLELPVDARKRISGPVH